MVVMVIEKREVVVILSFFGVGGRSQSLFLSGSVGVMLLLWLFRKGNCSSSLPIQRSQTVPYGS
jgi:hypothetical protein